MKIVMVYESLYGNTKIIGEAIAEGLREAGDVTAGTVDEIRPIDVIEAGLLVAGGPTHIHGMVSRMSRDAARKDERHGPPLESTELMRDWLDRLPADGRPAAAFDTRIDKPAWLTGSAGEEDRAAPPRERPPGRRDGKLPGRRDGWSTGCGRGGAGSRLGAFARSERAATDRRLARACLQQPADAIG